MASTEKKEAAEAARLLLTSACSGTLGSLNSDGSPLVTLVALATMQEGTPLLLLSLIAAHTQNILRDPRASLLIEGARENADPMTAPRLSVSGKVTALESTEVAAAKARFIHLHPGSASYDTDLDFAYYRLAITGARFNQGFGRFRKLGPNDLVVSS